MKIACVFGLFPPSHLAEIQKNSKGGLQYAADALQWAVVRGFEGNNHEIKIFNLPYIGSYPLRYKKIFSKSFKFSHKAGANDLNIGFNNLTYFKLYSRYRRLKYCLHNWLTKNGGDATIIIYAIHVPFIKAVTELKKKFPKLRICLIVPDLPEHVGRPNTFLNNLLGKLERRYLNQALLEINGFVVISKWMYEPLLIGNRPWICIEGIYEEPPEVPMNTIMQEMNRGAKNILYSGTLAKRYGIVILLDAFSKIIGDEYRLWICGSGECEGEIVDRMQKDSRIIFFGQIPRIQVLELQRRATVLVNPRTSEGDFTKYSFPSKTMEYLASGTPTILNRLPGIPDEYYDYCLIAEQENAESLKDKIVSVCEMSPETLTDFGENARVFVFRNKSSTIQVKKIIELLNKL